MISSAASTNIESKPFRGLHPNTTSRGWFWFESYDDPILAISREKELKKWKRAWKVQLIEKDNPKWDDLFDSICNQGGHSGTARRANPKSRDSGFDASHRPGMTVKPSPPAAAVPPPPWPPP
jgi:putative endonuclease